MVPIITKVNIVKGETILVSSKPKILEFYFTTFMLCSLIALYQFYSAQRINISLNLKHNLHYKYGLYLRIINFFV